MDQVRVEGGSNYEYLCHDKGIYSCTTVSVHINRHVIQGCNACFKSSQKGSEMFHTQHNQIFYKFAYISLRIFFLSYQRYLPKRFFNTVYGNNFFEKSCGSISLVEVTNFHNVIKTNVLQA